MGSNLLVRPASNDLAGGVDTTETEVKPASAILYSRFNGTDAFVPVVAPTPTPVENYAKAIDDYTAHLSSPGNVAVLLGRDGRQFTNATQLYHFLIGSVFTPGLTVGQTVKCAFAFKVVSGFNGNSVRVWFKDGTNATDFVEGHFQGGNAGSILTGAWNDLTTLTAPTTANDARNRVIPLGSGVYLIVIAATATGTVTGPIHIGTACPTLGAVHEAMHVYCGLHDYEPNQTDGREVVLLPGGGGASLTLTATPANRYAVLTAPGTQLVLPNAPSSGVRDFVLRLSMGDPNTLLLPSAGNIKYFGAASPELTEGGVLTIRQYAVGRTDFVFVPEN